MKTAVIDIRCYSFARSKDGKSQPITLSDQAWFVGSNLKLRQKENIADIKQMLKKGGFLYGSDLWKWTVKKSKYMLELWVRLTFEDSNNIGKNLFMNLIRKTGLLQYGTIIKNYG